MSTSVSNEKKKKDAASHFSFCSVFFLTKTFTTHRHHLYCLSHFIPVKNNFVDWQKLCIEYCFNKLANNKRSYALFCYEKKELNIEE
jgi:hypothetical protein